MWQLVGIFVLGIIVGLVAFGLLVMMLLLRWGRKMWW